MFAKKPLSLSNKDFNNQIFKYIQGVVLNESFVVITFNRKKNFLYKKL